MRGGPDVRAKGKRPGAAPDPYTLPPQNLEAEQGVIGSALIDPDTLDLVGPVVSASDFYRDSHQIIFSALIDMRVASSTIDPITLIDELMKRGQLAAAGGDDYVADCIASVPHAANAVYYAGIVKEHSVRRAVIEACNEVLREAFAVQTTAAELVESLERRAFALGDVGRTVSANHVSHGLGKAMASIDARLAGQSVGLGTPWPDVDAIADRLLPERLTVVAGRPSMGKTAMALNVASHAACVLKLPALFCCVEMSDSALAERLLAERSGVPSYVLRNGLMNQGQWTCLNDAVNELNAAPLVLDDASMQSVMSIGSAARRVSRRYGGLGLLVVDYLQLLTVMSGEDSRQEQIAKMSRAFKILARDLKCPVVLLSQLNREVEKREDRRPRMADLRESGAIEQDADVVILLHRPEYYKPDDSPGLAEFIVAKNRHGATGSATVGWNPSVGKFYPSTSTPAIGPPPPAAPVPDESSYAPEPDGF